MNARDTQPDAQREHLRMLRAMGPQRRYRAAASLSESVRAMLWRTLRASMPAASDAEVRLAFIRRLYGEAVVEQIELGSDR